MIQKNMNSVKNVHQTVYLVQKIKIIVYNVNINLKIHPCVINVKEISEML